MIWRFYPISILIGLASGTLVQLVVLVPATAVLAALSAAPPGPDLAAEILQRTEAHVLVLVSLVFAYLAAGYTTARFAAGEELVNAAAAGAVVVLLGVAAAVGKTPWSVFPAWVDWVSIAFAIPMAVAGGVLFRRRAFAG